MKLIKTITFPALFIAFVCLFQNVQAQETTVSIQAENEKLSTLFEKVATQYQAKFAYDADRFSKIETSINVKNVTVADLVKKLSEKHSFEYKLIDGTWVLYLVEHPAQSMKNTAIRGKVSDLYSGEALLYCHVIRNETMGSYTNELGHFTFDAPENSIVQVIISHLGYHRLDTVLLASAKAPFYELKLTPFPMALAEIKVLSLEKNVLEMTAQPDIIAFNPIQSANIPRVDESDLVNALTLIPGINFLGGAYSGLSIRGGSPSENRIVIDGIPVLETNHLFGNVSVLNAKFVKQAFVSRGGFDTRYGGRVSGIVDLTGKSGKKNKPEADVTANLLNGNVFAAIPLGDKVSLSGAYRRSYIDQWQNYLFDQLQELSITESDGEIGNTGSSLTPTIHYQDANAKLSVRPNENQEISLNFLMMDESQLKDYEFSNERFFRSENVDGKNMGGSANWSFQHKNRMNKFSASMTDLNRNSMNESGRLSITNNSNGKGNGKSKDKSDKYEMESDMNEVHEQQLSWQSELKHGIFQHHFGGGFTNDEISYRFEAQKTSGNIPIDSLSENRSAEIYHAYYQQQISPIKKISIRAGVRLDYENLQQRMLWQPRGGIYMYPNNELQVYYLVGRYNQLLSKIRKIDNYGNSDLAWYLPGDDGDGLLSSIHHIVGTRYEKGKLLVNVEAYQKATDGKMNLFAEVYKRGPETRISYEAYSGDEITRGVDFFVQYRNNNWTQLLAYTFSKSDERYDGYNSGAYFPSFDDQRHRLRLVEMYKYQSWVASASWTFNTGSPVQASETGGNVQFDRLPYFSQIDLGLVKRFSYKSFSFDAGVSLLNVLNRKNVLETESFIVNDTSGSSTVRSELTGISFIPVFYLSLRVN